MPIDLLAIVTRPDFQSGLGPIGDHMGLARFAAARPALSVKTIVLNAGETRIHVEDGHFRIEQASSPPVELRDVRLVLYMPVCLEVEETNLGASAPKEAYPLFAAQQWRPITEYLEDLLPRLGPCVNTPRALRCANNKLIQLDTLRQAGLPIPATTVSTGYPREGALKGSANLIRKNVSEGGWKSATEFSPAEFSPARHVGATETDDPAPAIWQTPIAADHEFRAYVLGEEVIFVRLERQTGITDVRITNEGRPKATIVDGKPEWTRLMLAASRALDLRYAVIDALPDGDDLVILEVNANGVWWFLPDDVATVLEAQFHAFLDRLIGETRIKAQGERSR
jgi:hypothetical protein